MQQQQQLITINVNSFYETSKTTLRVTWLSLQRYSAKHLRRPTVCVWLYPSCPH